MGWTPQATEQGCNVPYTTGTRPEIRNMLKSSADTRRTFNTGRVPLCRRPNSLEHIPHTLTGPTYVKSSASGCMLRFGFAFTDPSSAAAADADADPVLRVDATSQAWESKTSPATDTRAEHEQVCRGADDVGLYAVLRENGDGCCS